MFPWQKKTDRNHFAAGTGKGDRTMIFIVSIASSNDNQKFSFECFSRFIPAVKTDWIPTIGFSMIVKSCFGILNILSVKGRC